MEYEEEQAKKKAKEAAVSLEPMTLKVEPLGQSWGPATILDGTSKNLVDSLLHRKSKWISNDLP